jgi:hypothetical protein
MRSKHYVVANPSLPWKEKVVSPGLDEPIEKLETTRVTKIQAHSNCYSIYSIGFVLNDGRSRRAGKEELNESYDFNQSSKLKEIEIIYGKNERHIGLMLFHHQDGSIKQLGPDYYKYSGRRDKFVLREDEQLVGVELNVNKYNDAVGITFMTL